MSDVREPLRVVTCDTEGDAEGGWGCRVCDLAPPAAGTDETFSPQEFILKLVLHVKGQLSAPYMSENCLVVCSFFA